ncbi:MAG: Ig domain-containing protein [Lewinellaceae bacterium]|nr:Ig domain-containing protein [Lewinellaceae bacterium]
MNRQLFKYLLLAPVLFLFACVKTEIIPETLEPVLTLSPSVVSLSAGENFQLTATYTDALGENRTDLIQWSSADATVASVSATGRVTALSAGQAWVVAAAPDGLTDSTLVTVVANSNAVARVDILNAPAMLNEGASATLQAKAFNSNNQEISGAAIIWSSSNTGIISVSPGGVLNALSSGTAAITATADGVSSLPANIQVLPPGGMTRSGVFSGNSGYTVKGTATLQQSATALTLTLGSDFMASNGPMLGVYLAKNASGGLSAQNSLKLGNLTANNGMQKLCRTGRSRADRL